MCIKISLMLAYEYEEMFGAPFLNMIKPTVSSYCLK